MIRIENENEIISSDGFFIKLKPPMSFSVKQLPAGGKNSISTPFSSPDKLKDFIEIKVKVVSTQLTQNGMQSFCSAVLKLGAPEIISSPLLPILYMYWTH